MDAPVERRVVGPDQKPEPHPFYGDSYERGTDPWHASAFVGTPAEGRIHSDGTPAEGWYLLDAWENVIGWVPDGTPLLPQEPADVRP